MVKTIAEALTEYAPKQVPRRRGGNSELDAIIGEIEKVVPMTTQYGFGFWRKVLSRHQIRYGDIHPILKEISNMGVNKQGLPYNKGATLVNVIKKLPLKPVKEKKVKKEKLITLNLFN